MSLRRWPLALMLLLSLPLHAGDLTLAPVGAPESAAATGLHLGFDPLSSSVKSEGGSVPVGTGRYIHHFASDFDTLPGDISSHEASLLIPILPLSYDRLRIVAGLNYRANWFESNATTLLPNDTLHLLRMPVAALYDLSDRWLLGVTVMPGISGDFSDLGDGFSLWAGAAAGYNLSDHLKIIGAVVFSHGFNETGWFPGIGVIWKPTPDWSISILPPTASVTRQFGENYVLSLFGRYEGPTWSVEADAAGPARDIQMRALHVGARLERRVANRFWVYLAAGMNFARKLEIENFNNSSLLEDDIDPGAFVQAGLNLRF